MANLESLLIRFNGFWTNKNRSGAHVISKSMRATEPSSEQSENFQVAGERLAGSKGMPHAPGNNSLTSHRVTAPILPPDS